jgi:hypothetical protein
MVAPLDIPQWRQPLWVAYTGPFSGGYQLVAIYTRQAGRWSELSWREYGYREIAMTQRSPEVTTVQVTPDRAWFVLDGFAGMHGSSWNLFSFDGEQLTLQVSIGNAAYNLGQIRDVNGDGVPDAVIDVSNYSLLCGSCDVGKISLQVWAWDPAAERMVRKHPRVVPATSEDDLAAKLNNEAVRLAYAGLWKDAARQISRARAIGAAGRLVVADTLAWNDGIIREHTDAMLAAIGGTRRGSGVPELNHLFYGDYDAVVEILRQIPINELFSSMYRPAPTTMRFVSNEVRATVQKALGVQPDLASAHFLKGWLAFEGDDLATERKELELAAALNPNEPFYKAAIARLAVLESY